MDLGKKYGTQTKDMALAVPNEPGPVTVHAIDIPEAMAQDILAGQPRFSVAASRPLPPSPAKEDLQALADGMRGRDLSLVCTDCARAVVRKAGRGTVVGYFGDQNPEATVGRDEGGHDIALIDGRWVVDTWYRATYDADAPAVLDLADPDDRATARRLYGDPATWEPASKAEAEPHAAQEIEQNGFLSTGDGAVYVPPQRRYSFTAHYGHASGEPGLGGMQYQYGMIGDNPRLRGYPGPMKHLVGRGQHNDGITVWESAVPADWFTEPGLRYDTMRTEPGTRYRLEIDADEVQILAEGQPIRADIARALNTQALVRQVDIEFGANTLGHNVPSRLNVHFARLRGSHPHAPEVERETTAFLVAAGIRTIRYEAHPDPLHPIETYPRHVVIDPSAIRVAHRWDDVWSSRVETTLKFQEKYPRRLSGLTDPRRSVEALRPRSSPESGALALLTVRALEGKEPTPEDAEKALRLFRATGIAPDEAVQRAKGYAKGTVGEAAKAALLTSTPQEALRKVEQAAELDAAVLAAAGIGAAAGARLGRTAEEAANRALRRAVVEATGTDLQELVVDTGADLTATMLTVLPETFGPSAKREAEEEPVDLEAEAGEGAGEAEGEPAEPQPEPEATPEQLADRDQRCRQLVEMVKAWHAQYQARRKKRQEEREALRKEREAEGLPDIDEEADEEADDGEEMAVGPIPKELLRAASVDLTSAMELARFMRIWTGDWIVRQSNGALTPDTVWKDRESVERYRRTMQQQLRQMAAGLLADGDASQRLVAEMVGEIPSTSNAHEIERRTASVLRVIQRNAIRQSRDRLTRDLAKALKERGAQGRLFAPMEEDLKRKVAAESEDMARYLARVVRMGPKAVEREKERLAKVLADRAKLYDDTQDAPATDVATDREYHYALVRQALLDRYGGLRQQLPAEILRAGAEIEEWLTSEQERLRVRWHQIAERNQVLSDAIADAVAPADVDRPKLRETWWDRLTDSLVATVRQRLQDAVKLARNDDVRRTAYEAIDEAMYYLSSGAELYATRQKAYRDAWYDLVAEVAGGKGKVPEYMRHLNEPIPAEVSQAVSRQGYAGTMTYGQAMQLYASLTQEFYQTNVAEHGRHRHAALIASILAPADLKLVQRLRAVYEQRREELSDAVQAVTGVPVWRPDPLYMPVRMLVGNREGLRAHGVRNWSPLAATLTPRVRNRKDFDESASIQGVYWERAKDNAAAIAYGENGIRVRGIVGRANVKDAIERYHGPRRAGELYRQIEEALMGERAPTTQPHEKIMERVLRLNTYVSLSWNPLSTIKQTLSFPVWAMYLPDGFAGMHRAFGESVRNPQTLREFIDSDGFRARYGSGVMTEILDVLTEPGTNPVKRFFQLGMRGIQFGDAVPSLLVGAGLYRARRDALIDQGMDPDEAARRAKTEAWAMVEETQQSSRPENLIPLYRNGGVLARAFLQFASAPVLQLSHEVQAIRNAKAGVPGAREAAVRAVLVNHLVMPALMRATTLLFQAILGDLPEEDEIPDYALWFLYDCVLGPFSRVFLVGQWATTAYDAVVRRKRTPFARLLPAENVFRLTETLGVTAHDLLTLRTEDLQKDFLDVLRDTSSPGRQIVRFWRSRVAEED